MGQIINAYLYCTVLPLEYFKEQTYESGALWVLLTAPLLPDFLDRRGGGVGGGSALLFNQGGELLFQLLSFRSPECTPELEFLKRLWGLGTEEEEGYRTGPPGNIG